MAADGETRALNESRVRDFMQAISATDFEALAEICHPDFIAELPYGEPAVRLEGFEAYRTGISVSLEVFRFRLDLVCIHPGLDPNLLIAEYTSDGIAVPTGKPYANVYIGIFRFREGRLVSLREFFNPAAAARALEPE